jgi:hypothetical protein
VPAPIHAADRDHARSAVFDVLERHQLADDGAPVPVWQSRKVPVLDVGEAATWLADGWVPFMFFTNRDSGRGNLLYRRYDGNVTLVRPA